MYQISTKNQNLNDYLESINGVIFKLIFLGLKFILSNLF